MSEKYFNEKSNIIHHAIANEKIIKPILEQIALDQREACVKALPGNQMEIPISLLKAIRNAEIGDKE